MEGTVNVLGVDPTYPRVPPVNSAAPVMRSSPPEIVSTSSSLRTVIRLVPPDAITRGVVEAVGVPASQTRAYGTLAPAAAIEVVKPAVEVAAVIPLSNVYATAFAGAADRTPAPNVATATSAMRLRSVFVDMFFLSLVRFRNFLDLARRSFDLLIPLLL
jgi:hypothetical protein